MTAPRGGFRGAERKGGNAILNMNLIILIGHGRGIFGTPPPPQGSPCNKVNIYICAPPLAERESGQRILGCQMALCWIRPWLYTNPASVADSVFSAVKWRPFAPPPPPPPPPKLKILDMPLTTYPFSILYADARAA